MNWVTWRQYRLEPIICGAVLVVLAAILVPVGFQNLALLNSLGLANPDPSLLRIDNAIILLIWLPDKKWYKPPKSSRIITHAGYPLDIYFSNELR